MNEEINFGSYVNYPVLLIQSFLKVGKISVTIHVSIF